MIYHEVDNDCDTDEEMVEKHIKTCLQELQLRINEVVKGDLLSLVRNVREEFSGIQELEINNSH